MNNKERKARYLALAQNAKVERNLKTDDDNAENRGHPRFLVQAIEMQVNVSHRVSVIDISRAGVSFLSGFRFYPGQTFDFKIGAVFSIQAEVKECEMVETDSNFMEVEFRVRSEFNSQELDLDFLLAIIDR